MPVANKNKTQKKTASTVRDVIQPSGVCARPFLKWAGGKGQLLSKFRELYPKQLKNKKIKLFYEPFLGSGAVFFDIAQNYKIESAILYDINEELILAYKVIQKDVSKLLDFLFRYQRDYLKLDKLKRREYYYEQRTNYNLQRFNIDYDKYSENWISRAAQLIFLNKTCFNGLFRVNSKGEFNSPVGDYDKPTICNEQNLSTVSEILEIAEIKKADFKEIIADFKAESFVYFDPPYRPISKTANFRAYSKHDFTDVEQIQLADLFRQLDAKGAKLMLSNSDPKNNNDQDNFFDDIYKDYNIYRIPAKRVINSDATKRGIINEIVVTNYSIN
jgi:DNA adenine methylase